MTIDDIGFTCSGSTDYLAGTAFSFVSTLDGVGPWPPIQESHVEMDGAWALYEAWVKLNGTLILHHKPNRYDFTTEATTMIDRGPYGNDATITGTLETDYRWGSAWTRNVPMVGAVS